jgi:hypothetical protein
LTPPLSFLPTFRSINSSSICFSLLVSTQAFDPTTHQNHHLLSLTDRSCSSQHHLSRKSHLSCPTDLTMSQGDFNASTDLPTHTDMSTATNDSYAPASTTNGTNGTQQLKDTVVTSKVCGRPGASIITSCIMHQC